MNNEDDFKVLYMGPKKKAKTTMPQLRRQSTRVRAVHSDAQSYPSSDKAAHSLPSINGPPPSVDRMVESSPSVDCPSQPSSKDSTFYINTNGRPTIDTYRDHQRDRTIIILRPGRVRGLGFGPTPTRQPCQHSLPTSKQEDVISKEEFDKMRNELTELRNLVKKFVNAQASGQNQKENEEEEKDEEEENAEEEEDQEEGEEEENDENDD